MKCYCRDGAVIATHDDGQDVPASAYGADVYIVRIADGTVLERLGDAPAPGLPDLRPYAAPPVNLATYVADKRRAVIAAGCVVTVAGVEVPSWADADSTGALTALVVAAQINPQIEASWKGRDGLFYGLSASDIVALATGVMVFVQSAFAVEAALVDAIDAGTVTTVADVDAAAWPSNN